MTDKEMIRHIDDGANSMSAYSERLYMDYYV